MLKYQLLCFPDLNLVFRSRTFLCVWSVTAREFDFKQIVVSSFIFNLVKLGLGTALSMLYFNTYFSREESDFDDTSNHCKILTSEGSKRKL